MKNKKTKKCIYIEWCDAVSDGSANWVTDQEAKDWANNEDWLIIQLGFLIQETKEYILVASKFNPQDKTENRFSGLQKIPKTWIRKMKAVAL